MIQVPQNIIDALIAYAKADAPNECCGLLAGKEGLASEIYPIPNLPSDDPAVKDLKVPEDRRLRYVMDPKAQISAFKAMRENGTEMMAIYHSHTASEAYPSATDVRLAFDPEVHYLIVSLEKPDAPVLRAFRIVNEEIDEDAIETLSL